MGKRVVLLLVFLKGCFTLAFGEIEVNNDYIFRTFSPEGGLYYDGIRSIRQDADGFIWVMLENDIYRFDGYQFTSYQPYFSSLLNKHWIFYALETDEPGNLYLATNNGLYRYDNTKDNFELLLQKNVTLAISDQIGNLWVKGDYLGIYNKEQKNILGVRCNKNLIDNAEVVRSCGSEVYAGTSNGEIFHYDSYQKEFFPLYAFPEKYSIVDISQIGDKIWVLTESNGLFQIDPATSQCEKAFSFFCVHNNERVPAKVLYADKKGALWVGTQRGLYIIDPENGHYSQYVNSNMDPNSLPSSSVWTITEDRRGNIWIGTYSGGVCYLDLNDKIHFKNYIPHENGLNHSVISGFAEDSHYLWIATEGGGLNRMDKLSGKFTYYNHQAGNSLTYDNVKSLVLDKKKNLWIAMFRGGMDCYHIQNDIFTHHQVSQNKSNGLFLNNLKKLALEPDSGLWIAYQSNRLYISFYSFERDKFTHIKFSPDRERIVDICRGVNDDLWIISWQSLFRMNVKDYSVQKIPLDTTLNIKPQTIHISPENHIWIGTIENGLIKYDIEHNKFSYHNGILKFGAATIFSICEDDGHYLWMGTDEGLFRYDTGKDIFMKFDKRDGLHGTSFYPLSCMKGSNGSLYFGGTTGFTVFKPKSIIADNFKPKAIVTKFFLDNFSVTPHTPQSPLNKTVTTTNEIILNHNQMNFGFEFSSDNHSIPEKTRFQYRLKGYDDRWVEVDATRRIATYAKVPAGNYSFEVKASSNDGSWDNTPTAIKIKRLPTPWNSLWAYIFYVFAGLTIIWVIFYYYNKQKKLKLDLYLENLEMTRKEEIHQERLLFFTNISHDFRTPLTLILAALENLKTEDKHHYRIMKNNSMRLLRLANELMDFRTVENGKMKLKLTLSVFNDCVDKVATDFQNYAEQRDIMFATEFDPELTVLKCFDEQLVEKIAMNLLNNSFKHTNQGGSISIETLAHPGQFCSPYQYSYTVGGQVALENSFCLIVRDTGVGISSASITNIFERFYKIEAPDTQHHLGSGIGLALVKSLVLLHKGTIIIYSERHKGTDILVALPTHPEIYGEHGVIVEKAYLPAVKKSNYVEPDHPASENKPVEPGIDGYSRGKKQLLIVEDNDDLREMLVEILSRTYHVTEATNGLEATGLIENKKTDLIISDIMMPLKDGIALCREIEGNAKTSHIPFIMLTAKSALEDKIKGTDAGADAYFEKPVDFNLLSATIQNIFERQQKLKEHYAQSFFLDHHEGITQQDNDLMIFLIEVIETNIDKPEMNVHQIASELSMSRSKLYSKIKTLTGKSIVEFVRSYKIKKAAYLMAKGQLSIREIMDSIGIESQSYFTHSFKNEFGETPASFAAKFRKKE